MRQNWQRVWGVICLALMLWRNEMPAYGSDNVIQVKTSAPWSVTGEDDLARLQWLMQGVGWEFDPTAETTAFLKKIGTKRIRCINVDPLDGAFGEDGSFTVGDPKRLLSHLNTCREIGASPHVILAVRVHKDLLLKTEDLQQEQEGQMGQHNKKKESYGPNDWEKFQKYCREVFEYVLIEQGFADACFEVGNEPDIGGTIHTAPPSPANGSRARYEGYWQIYQNVAEAARSFEQEHPDKRVTLGGPALAWAFTFRYGDFNWADRFLQDCAENNTKLDYLGVHFYGNISSLNGEYPANFPSFRQMLAQTTASRDQFFPGLPIWMTEWGASYQGGGDASVVNSDHIGAAWSMAFLEMMLQSRIDNALFLITTDGRRPLKDNPKEYENWWGWPSLFVNPKIFGKAYPKPTAHVFDMISRLHGQRVEATRGTEVNSFVVADPSAKTVQALLWSYHAQIQEHKSTIENAQREAVVVRIRDAGAFFPEGVGELHVSRLLVAEHTGNIYDLHKNKIAFDDENTALPEVDKATIRILDGAAEFGFALPPSGVTLVTFSLRE